LITTTDIFLGKRAVAGLAAGGASTAETALTVPSSVTSGTYYFGAIADYNNQVVESNETNNAIFAVRKVSIK
jgi:subtilase family serine protease